MGYRHLCSTIQFHWRISLSPLRSQLGGG
jgi:hypothetical protein